MGHDQIPSGNALLSILIDIIKKLLKDPGYEEAILGAFRRLAHLMHVDRVYLFSIYEERGEVIGSLKYEHAGNHCLQRADNKKLHRVPIQKAGYGRWLELFEKGEVIEGYLEEFPLQEQALLLEEGITSLICIPVFVKRKLWGFFGIDLCHRKYKWRKRDKLILQFFADLLAGVIETHQQDAMLSEQKMTLLQFYELLENIQIEVHLFESSTMHYTYMNRTALENLGYDEEEFMLLTPKEIFHGLEPEEIYKKILPLLDDKKEKLFVEAWQRRKDGSIYPVETRLARMTFNGSEHLVALVIDATERVEMQKALAEEKQMFEELFRHSIDAAALLLEGRCIDANEAALTLYGVSRGEMLGKSPAELSPEIQPDGTPSDQKAVEMIDECEHYGSCRFEWLHRDKEGREFWVDVALTRLHKEGKNLIYAVLRDITKRKENEVVIINQQNQLANTNNALNKRYEEELRLRQELEYYKKQLEEQVEEEAAKNREKDRLLHNQSKNIQMGEMLSMIAHQWRQPLNAISASAIAIAMKQELGVLSSEAISEHTAFVQKHTQAMSRTINDFMDFFKPEHDKQRFEVADLIGEIDSLIGAQLKSRGVTIRFEHEPGVAMYGYRKELSHVLINLIANTRDAYEGVELNDKYIDIAFVLKEGQWIITVEDYAGGIPQEHLDKIFNPYFTTKEPGKGTGIGLYMSRRIIEEVYRGSMDAVNTSSGARFSVTVPRVEEVAKEVTT